jgi:hypothetical protein
VKKPLIFLLIALIIGVIFVSISSISQNEDFEEEGMREERESEPQGRNLSVELNEKMGLSAP